MTTPLYLNHYSLVNALGDGADATFKALSAHRGGLRQCDIPHVDLDTWIGRVDELEREPLDGAWQPFDCRNNRLAWRGLQADGFIDVARDAMARYQPHRIGIFMGTSTSGIASTEAAYRERDDQSGQLPQWFDFKHTHNSWSVAQFVCNVLGISGPSLTISTACSSSAKVFATAHRYMQMGWIDAAIVGGVDSLCLTTLYGFNSLELVSTDKCRPWDTERKGINIGEAAGFALLEKEPNEPNRSVALLGYGESSDAYHMSTPHPDGDGAILAMQQALERAGLAPEKIDYINLHGTATPSNDRSEDRAVTRLFGNTVPCSSTKGWTGHTLGAAGISEAIISALAIQNGFMPGSLNTRTQDSSLKANVLLEGRHGEVNHVLSNSFGFGGSNCSLVFGRVPA